MGRNRNRRRIDWGQLALEAVAGVLASVLYEWFSETDHAIGTSGGRALLFVFVAVLVVALARRLKSVVAQADLARPTVDHVWIDSSLGSAALGLMTGVVGAALALLTPDAWRLVPVPVVDPWFLRLELVLAAVVGISAAWQVARGSTSTSVVTALGIQSVVAAAIIDNRAPRSYPVLWSALNYTFIGCLVAMFTGVLLRDHVVQSARAWVRRAFLPRRARGPVESTTE